MSNLTLGGIATHVRTAMDLDTIELPDALFDAWAREISDMIDTARERWPFRESEWTLTTTVDVASYDYATIGEADNVPANLAAVRNSSGNPIEYVSREEAEMGGYASNTPSGERWTTWGESLVLYPTPTVASTYTVRGYREGNDWVASGSGGVPDFPRKFDSVVLNWCMGRAYYQQEDPEMGQPLMDLSASQLEKLVRQYPDTPMVQPLIVGGARRYVASRPRYDWEG